MLAKRKSKLRQVLLRVDRPKYLPNLCEMAEPNFVKAMKKKGLVSARAKIKGKFERIYVKGISLDEKGELANYGNQHGYLVAYCPRNDTLYSAQFAKLNGKTQLILEPDRLTLGNPNPNKPSLQKRFEDFEKRKYLSIKKRRNQKSGKLAA
jgi:hypothetical protein